MHYPRLLFVRKHGSYYFCGSRLVDGIPVRSKFVLHPFNKDIMNLFLIDRYIETDIVAPMIACNVKGKFVFAVPELPNRGKDVYLQDTRRANPFLRKLKRINKLDLKKICLLMFLCNINASKMKLSDFAVLGKKIVIYPFHFNFGFCNYIHKYLFPQKGSIKVFKAKNLLRTRLKLSRMLIRDEYENIVDRRRLIRTLRKGIGYNSIRRFTLPGRK